LLSVHYGWRFSLNQLFWTILGPPNELYGFRNLILPQWIVATILSLLPALLGTMVYEKCAVTWRHFALAWLCWSLSFVLLYYLSYNPPFVCILQPLIHSLFGSQGMWESTGKFYAFVFMVFTFRAVPAAFLGMIAYEKITRWGRSRGERSSS
jgi:hypothetical protein